MSKEPYARFNTEELMLRDYLATDRTVLANERTFLSYTRTALAFGIGGGSLIHFLDFVLADIGGWVLLLLGAVTFIYGLNRYLWCRRRLRRILPE